MQHMNSDVEYGPLRRWSDQELERRKEYRMGDLFQALRRRKWVVLATFVVTAAALGIVFVLRNAHEAVCLVAVKRPSQIFVPIGSSGSPMVAAVGLLEGLTYRELIESYGFASKVARRLTNNGLPMAAEDVGARLSAEFKEPDLLRVRGRDKDPSRAVSVANAGCETLADLNQQELRAELESATESLTRLLGTAAFEVERAQDALGDYARRQRLANVDFNSSSSELFRALELLNQQELDRAREEARLSAAERRQRELNLAKGAPVDSLALPVEDPAIASLRTQIETVRVKLWDARKNFTSEHPTVKDLQGHLSRLEQELDERLQEARNRAQTVLSAEYAQAIRRKSVETNQEIVAHQAQVAAWTRLIDQQRRALGTVPGQRAELERRKLNLTFAEERYKTLSRRLDETRVSLESTKGTLSIAQRAVGTEQPNARKILIASVLLLVLPVGVGLLADYMDETVQNPAAFGRQVGLLCLASVPKTRALKSRSALRLEFEATSMRPFHVLRSGLRFAANGSEPRRIAIVGTRRGEGRSTLVLYLARALAEERKRVVIVDADVRTTGLALRAGVQSIGGLTEVVEGKRRLDEVLLRLRLLNGRPGVDAFLLAAKAANRVLPPNAELLFRSAAFKQLTVDLEQRADVILFDTPPLGEFADTLELLPHVDSVIFVADTSGDRDSFIQTLELVRTSGVRSLGVVVNKVRWS